MKKKLAIISSHPIQYNAPMFRELAKSSTVHPKVFYTWEQSATGNKFDPGFGKSIQWDIPLLDGYEYQFTKNIAPQPGTHHFKGIDTPHLIDEIKAWQPDAILVYGWSFKSHLAVMRHFKGKVPILFRGDSTLLNDKGDLKSFIRSLALRWVYRYVDYALYVGANNKRYYQKMGLKPAQLVYACHAIDNQRFAQPADQYNAQAAEWRLKLGIQPGDFVILYAGKIEPVKNPHLLIWLAQQLPEANVKILLVGNGKLEAQIKQLAAADTRILFVDFQNQQQMPVVYRLGEVFILPSLSETWGLAGNEAMACGTPIIMSSQCGGAVDLIRQGETGYLFPISDPSGCVVFLQQLIHQPELLQTIKNQAVQHIANFSFAQVVAAIEDTVAQATKQ